MVLSTHISSCIVSLLNFFNIQQTNFRFYLYSWKIKSITDFSHTFYFCQFVFLNGITIVYSSRLGKSNTGPYWQANKLRRRSSSEGDIRTKTFIDNDNKRYRNHNGASQVFMTLSTPRPSSNQTLLR